MTVLAEHDQEIRAAFGVMQAHIQALCEQDETAMSETLHFPHYRLSGAELKVWPTAEHYFSDFRLRAGSNWRRSEFRDIQALRASGNKVHLDAEIVRFDDKDNVIVSFRSLWVITYEDGIWAAKFRSSFAPA
ncbi:MAG: hypothetical protein AAF754_00945 [Pseudomonadota bacterium]